MCSLDVAIRFTSIIAIIITLSIAIFIMLKNTYSMLHQWTYAKTLAEEAEE